METKNTLLVDLETSSKKVKDAEIKVFGAYDPELGKYFIYKWGDHTMAKVTKLLKEYTTIITFNGKLYDIPILEKHGIPTNFRHIDIYEIFKNKRAALLGTFENYSLKGLILRLGLDNNGKGDIDYEIFKKTEWTGKDQEEIITYLKQDLLLEWKLWNYLTIRFAALAKYLTQKDAEQYKHITTSLTTYTYKIICKGAGIQELYDERPKATVFPRPHTIPPRKLAIKGPVVLLKFTYLYPHTIIQFNTLSYNCRCCPGNEGRFHGRNYWRVKGFYCQRNHGSIEKFLKTLYQDAEKDPGLKTVFYIVYNNLYNVITNGAYYATYDMLATQDTLSLGKQQMKIVMDMFEDKGYYIAYVEGDNIFVALDTTKGQTLDTLTTLKDETIKFLKSKMPFPSETFDIELRDNIKYIRFFQIGPKSRNFHLKGQYVYITERGGVVSKGVTAEEIQQAVAEV